MPAHQAVCCHECPEGRMGEPNPMCQKDKEEPAFMATSLFAASLEILFLFKQ